MERKKQWCFGVEFGIHYYMERCEALWDESEYFYFPLGLAFIALAYPSIPLAVCVRSMLFVRP